MPNRILREGILTSSRIAKLGWAEEVFYRRLHSVVDDFGRYFADVGLLRAACYPRQLNKVSDSDVEKWLQATEKAALVRVYPAEDGERYLQVLDFNQQVRAKRSRFPQMPSGCVADAKHLPEDAHLDVSVDVDVYAPQAAAKPRSRRTDLPDGFGVSERVIKWAEANKHSHLEKRLEHFVSYVKRNGKKYVDWDEAFMGAVREDWAKLGSASTDDDPYGLKKAINYGG